VKYEKNDGKMQPVTQEPVIPLPGLRRPTGITVLALLYFVVGAILLILGVIFPILGPALTIEWLIALAIGWGLWTGKGWSWWLTVIIEALDLLSGLAVIASGDLKSLTSLLISVRGLIAPLILWYMFRPHVKIFFGIGYRRGGVARGIEGG
jgi:hypothetical protein